MNARAASIRPVMLRPAPPVLELKIPPVALVIVAAALMWLGAVSAPGFNLRLPAQPLIASVFGSLGLVTCALGVVEIRKAKTTVNPTKPQSSTSLVTSGIYGHTRNPMYLGFLLILIGWSAVTANMLAFLALPAFVLYMNQFQIKPEERALRATFGDAFTAYRSAVRRWI